MRDIHSFKLSSTVVTFDAVYPPITPKDYTLIAGSSSTMSRASAESGPAVTRSGAAYMNAIDCGRNWARLSVLSSDALDMAAYLISDGCRHVDVMGLMWSNNSKDTPSGLAARSDGADRLRASLCRG